MSTYTILLNCALGGLALYLFACVIKMVKEKTHRGVIISCALMTLSIVIGIILDVTQAFFLSSIPENFHRIIQRLDANIVGYYLGMATFFVLCVRVQKKDKSPNQRVHSIAGSARSE